MHRRQLLHYALAATATGLVAPAAGLPAFDGLNGAPHTKRPYGVQLYMFREQMFADPHGTLSQLSAAGFEQVELFSFGASDLQDAKPLYGLSVKAFIDLLGESGMNAPMAHTWGNVIDLGPIAEVAHQLGVKRIVEPFAIEYLRRDEKGIRFEPITRLADWERVCERLNTRGQQLRALGLDFAYHNHHIDFLDIEGREGFAFLAENTDPSYVSIELDVGWVAAAQRDPVVELTRYLDRVVGCHLKDYAPHIPLPAASAEMVLPELARLVTPGKGAVDFRSIIGLLDKADIAHGFIEVDVSEDPMTDAMSGLKHLRSLTNLPN